VKQFSRKIKMQDWENLVISLEIDLKGPRRTGLKTRNKLKINTKDYLKISAVASKEWEIYCDMTAERRNSGTKEAAIARQQRGKHISATTNQHETVEELFESVFSVWSAPRLYSEDQWEKLVSRGIGQGEAKHRKYKRHKLGGRQA
jgi:hypothetical protein